MRKFKFELILQEEDEKKKVEVYENNFYTVKKIYYKTEDYTLFRISSKDPSLPELIVREEDLKAVDVDIILDTSNPISIDRMLKLVENVNIALVSANKIKKLF